MKDPFAEAQEFRNRAEKLGLMMKRGDEAPHHFLDINMGQIKVAKENLRALYNLALEFDTEMGHENFGEHSAIGQLVCPKKHLSDERVYWMRPYHRMGVIMPEDWISIRGYLGIE